MGLEVNANPKHKAKDPANEAHNSASDTHFKNTLFVLVVDDVIYDFLIRNM